MSFAGRAANSNGCVSRPKEHETGLSGFAAQIRRSSLIGSCAMETAEHREPCESRGSRTDLGAPGGEIPPGDSTNRGICSPSPPALRVIESGAWFTCQIFVLWASAMDFVSRVDDRDRRETNGSCRHLPNWT